MEMMEMKYLESLAEIYPTIAKASTEIINLQAILSLPKGTEHFLSDVHGEYEAFSHVLKNGSGSIRRKIDDVFGHTMSQKDKKTLATLIYYPREKIRYESEQQTDMQEWYRIMLYRLIEVCKCAASKYTRSKVRKALPPDFAYVIEELITEKPEVSDKVAYYEQIISAIIEVGRADKFIVALGELIQRLIIDHLHILGDIYDRGPAPDKIIDKLMEYHSLDIQWGNHDVLWMGAACGQRVCMASVVRICARYANLDILEDGYGINLLPLATFALKTYENDPCSCFKIKGDNCLNPAEMDLNMKMHKAISIIAFKLEGQLLLEHPEFGMENRILLDKIDYEAGTITLDTGTYPLLDQNFPTIDPADPYRLSEEEENVITRLDGAFTGCEKLQKHMSFLLNKGSLYKIYNQNLLYHGCIPLCEDGSFSEVKIHGALYHGKELYDVLESYVRMAFVATDPEKKQAGRDMLWFIWSSADSPLFGKDKMATFERYFIEDKVTHVEKKNPYYTMQEDEVVLGWIMEEFARDDKAGRGYEEDAGRTGSGNGCGGKDYREASRSGSAGRGSREEKNGEENREYQENCKAKTEPVIKHIINGHVPVHHSNGESPVKGNGKLLVIDGGLSKAYQKETGIAGYTLIYNSWGLILAAHQPFTTAEDAVKEEMDILSDTILVKKTDRRKLVGDTDNGKKIKARIQDLQKLLQAYRSGLIVEK